MIRVAVVGCSSHATNSIWPALRVGGMQIVGVAARHLERAQTAADRWSVGAAFDNIDRMLDQCRPDAVVAVVPPDQYGTVMTTVLERGLPMLVDKPAAASSAEAIALAELAEARRASVVVGYQKRFAASYRTAKQVIDDSSFGQISLGSMQWTMGSVGGASMRDWIFENPVHHIDLARFLFGDITDVDVRVGRAATQHSVVIAARSESGAALSMCIGTVASWFHRNEVVDVYGEGNSVTVTNVDTVIHRPPDRPERVWRPNYTVPIPINSSAAVMGFAGEAAHFAEVVTDGVASLSDLRSAAATLALTERIADAVQEASER